MNQLNLLKNEFKHLMSGILAIGKQTGTTLGHWVNVRETGLVSGSLNLKQKDELSEMLSATNKT